jgi:hypothetical protein
MFSSNSTKRNALNMFKNKTLEICIAAVKHYGDALKICSISNMDGY